MSAFGSGNPATSFDSLYESAVGAVSVGSEQGRVGYYNRNIRVDDKVVRIPIPEAEQVDPRAWSEPEVLAVVGRYVGNASRLLYASDSPTYQIHEFIPGTVLTEVAPRGTAFPRYVVDAVADLFATLATIPRSDLPRPRDGWPGDDERDTSGFAAGLVEFNDAIHAKLRQDNQPLYQLLGIPDDPLGPVRGPLSRLRRRPFSFLHADLHRGNILLGREHVVSFLDWELAQWGDPVYDLALHLHRSVHPPQEESYVTDRWLERMPPASVQGWREDVEAYRAGERVKAVLGDSVRYSQRIAGGCGPEAEAELVSRLALKLAAAAPVWGLREPLGAEAVAEVLAWWAEVLCGRRGL